MQSEVWGRKETLKIGFRAKDAKNAKKLLQGELVNLPRPPPGSSAILCESFVHEASVDRI
jgi:hypothetical protein